MATMKKMVAKKAPKKYEMGGSVPDISKNAKPAPKPKTKPKTASQRIGDITLRDIKNSAEDALNVSTLGLYGKAKKKVKEVTGLKNGGSMKKAKSGASLGMKSVKSGYDNNPGVTRADIISAVKSKAKSGASMKKMQYGGKAASMAPKAKAGTMMKAGGKMAKCKYGCK